MTTGSWYTGFWQPASVGGMIGHFVQKSWAGDDDPPLPPLPRQPPSYIYRAYLNDIRNVKKIRVHNGPRPRRTRKHVTPHNYHCDVFAMEDSVYGHVNFGNPQLSNTSGLRAPSWAATSLLDANDQLALIGKLKEKLQGSDFNLGIFLAEGHETLRMVADTAHRIDRSIRFLRTGNFGAAARTLVEGTSRTSNAPPYRTSKELVTRNEKALYNQWLQLQYGWLPLLKDVEAGAQFLAHKVQDLPVMRTSVSKRKEFPFTFVAQSNGEPAAFVESKGAKTHRRTLTVYHHGEPPSLAQQLGLLDPLSVAWEKMPWSFVVDWFIPVGQFLNANGFSPGVNSTCVTSDKLVGRQGFGENDNGLSAMAYFQSSFTRVVGPFDIPLPVFKGLGTAASWRHCANAIALLGQTFRK